MKEYAHSQGATNQPIATLQQNLLCKICVLAFKTWLENGSRGLVALDSMKPPKSHASVYSNHGQGSQFHGLSLQDVDQLIN